MESKILDIIPELISIFICGIMSKLIVEKSFKLKMSLLSSFAHSFTIIFLGTVIGFQPILIGLLIPSEALRTVVGTSTFVILPATFMLCSFLVFKSALKKETDCEVSKKSILFLSLTFTFTFFILFYGKLAIDLFLEGELL